jgi:hypothetical protein
MERIATPADCALAVALPLTFEEFARDAVSPHKDFARSVVANSGRSVDAAWRELYEPKVMSLYTRVVARAESLGVTVVPRVTADALRALLERFHVVSLFAHSRLAPVRPDDIVMPTGILETIEAGDLVVTVHLRDLFATQQWASDEAVLRDQLADALDRSLEPSRAWSASTVARDDSDRPAHYLNRVMLEDALGAALRPAPLLELRDGLVTHGELLAMIPGDFDGVLDLSVCNSVALGESIKRRRPHCLVVENMFLARIDLRLVRYGLVVSQLAREPARFTDALLEIKRALLKDRS